MSATSPISEEIQVRTCEKLEEFHACVELQRQIWGEADLEIEPVTLFVVASHTGGQVLGAFDGYRLVGYTLALAGVRGGAPYLHSHMTGVLSAYRDRGVGRSLKLFQREEALGRGIRLIEWTFDPLETRNAHFNLNRLGAICRRYLPNLYGVTTSPLHRGLPTDRLVAEWFLDSAHVHAALSQKGPDRTAGPATISLPAELDQWKAEAPERLKTIQTSLREQFTDWFSRGYAAVAVRQDASGPAYVLIPWSEF
jgi:predicted GNAT superfamily acetyltransferase